MSLTLRRVNSGSSFEKAPSSGRRQQVCAQKYWNQVDDEKGAVCVCGKVRYMEHREEQANVPVVHTGV